MTVNLNSKLSSDYDHKLFKFIFIIALISILPFLIFFFFVIPCSDDIFYHNYVGSMSLWNFMLDHYNNWTGRYVSNFFMAVNPFSLTSDLAVYPLMLIVLFLLFCWSLYFFLSSSLNRLSDKAFQVFGNNQVSLMSAVLFLALFFHNMPRPTDSFYWFAGTSSHLFPMSLFLFSLGLFFRHGFQKQLTLFSLFFISASSFLISGSNETLALQWLFVLFFILIYQKVIFHNWDKRLFFPLLFALIGFAILYLAPGNTVRAKALSGGHDIGLLLVKPFGLILETTVRYISIALLWLLLWGGPVFKRINDLLSPAIKTKNSLLLLSLFGLGLFALTFVPSVWTMGGLPPRRVINNTYLMFLLYGGFLLCVSFHKIDLFKKPAQWVQARLTIRMQKIVFATSFLFLFNNFYAWKDLGNLYKFQSSQNERLLILESSKGQDLILPPLDYFPTTFFYEDITIKTSDYRNTAFASFYGLRSVTLLKEYP